MPDANNIKAEEREAMPKAIDTGIILLMLDIRCGPSMIDYPKTSGNLWKLAAAVSGRFPEFFIKPYLFAHPN